MKTIYLLRDDDPLGGYFCAVEEKPRMSLERDSIMEIRSAEIEPSLWETVLTGQLPVDEDGSNDSTWMTIWPAAQTVWVR